MPRMLFRLAYLAPLGSPTKPPRSHENKDSRPLLVPAFSRALPPLARRSCVKPLIPPRTAST